MLYDTVNRFKKQGARVPVFSLQRPGFLLQLDWYERMTAPV